MRPSVIVGALLLLFGIALALPMMPGFDDQPRPSGAQGELYERQTDVLDPGNRQALLTIGAGVLIAGGAILIGVGIGNWRHPDPHRNQTSTDPKIG